MAKPKTIFSGIRQYVANFGHPQIVLTKAKIHPKMMHCFNPQNNKIDSKLLEPLLKEYHHELWEGVEIKESEEAAELRRKIARADIEEMTRDRLKEKILYKEDIEQAQTALVNAVTAILQSKLVVDFPQQIVGHPVETIAIKCKDLANTLIMTFKNLKYAPPDNI